MPACRLSPRFNHDSIIDRNRLGPLGEGRGCRGRLRPDCGSLDPAVQEGCMRTAPTTLLSLSGVAPGLIDCQPGTAWQRRAGVGLSSPITNQGPPPTSHRKDSDMNMQAVADHPVHELIARRWSPYAFA